MPLTSDWPLPPSGVRFLVPPSIEAELDVHPITHDLYPVALGYYPEALGHSMVRENHHSNLLLYCVRGKGYFSIEDGEETVVGEGDLVILPAGSSHRYHADDEDPWSIYWVHYRGSLATHYSQLIVVSESLVRIGESPKTVAEFCELLELRDSGFARLAFIHAACRLKQLLSGIAVIAAGYRQPEQRRIELEEVQAKMQSAIHTHLDLSSLAEEAGLSKFHFSRRFKQMTGHSPIQHFIHLKMQYACHQFDQGAKSVKEVASSVGYSDPYYFSRLFRQVMGMSPSDYRKAREV